MNFELSEDQALLKESVERFVAREYSFEKRREVAASEEGFLRETWATFAGLGWLGATIPEEYGGTGGDGIETMVLMEAFGRALAVEPYVPSVVLGGGLVAAAGSEAQKREMLPALAEGRMLLAFAYAEPDSRYDLNHVGLAAREDGAGYVLDGAKCLVLGGDCADRLIVSARTEGETRDQRGISLFVVERGVHGLAIEGYPTVDGLRAAEVSFDGVAVGADRLLGPKGEALPVIERAIDRAAAAVSAEALGIMQALHDATLAYAKTREQFGRAIGSFQALQHRMVDMMIACEETRSLVLVSAMKADDTDMAGRLRAISAAKVKVGEAGRLVGQEAIQIHGGMGMTDELIVGHWFKRLSVIARLFGDAGHHLRRFAGL
jgi:alkylation response protein AidB-like acyl-CoA dehydrogenase